MTFRISNLAATAMVDSYTTMLNGGTLKVYTGAQPATVDTAASGTLLGSLDYLADSAPSGTDGVADIGTPVTGTATAGGTMGYGRGFNSGGQAIFDGSITLSGNGGDLIASNLTVAIDDVIQITSQSFTQPKV